MLSPLPISGGEESMKGGAKRRGVPVKTLKKLLKKAGLKTSGKKATLTRRAKKARLMKGGQDKPMMDTTQVAKVKTAEEEAEEAKKAAEEAEEEAAKVSGTSEGGRKRRKSRGLKLF